MTKSKLFPYSAPARKCLTILVCAILLSSCSVSTPDSEPQKQPKKIELSANSIELSAVFSAELSASRNNFSLATEKYLEAAAASQKEKYYELAAYSISHAMNLGPSEHERQLAKRVNEQWVQDYPSSEKRIEFTVRFLVNKGRILQAISLALRADTAEHQEQLLSHSLHALNSNLWQPNIGPLINALDKLSKRIPNAEAAPAIQAYLLWPTDKRTSDRLFYKLIDNRESTNIALYEHIYLTLLTDSRQYSQARELILQHHSKPYDFNIAVQLAKLDALELHKHELLEAVETDFPQLTDHTWFVKQLHWALTHDLPDLAAHYLSKAEDNPQFANSSHLYRARLAFIQGRTEDAIAIYLSITNTADLPYASRGLNELLLSKTHIDPRFDVWYNKLKSENPSAQSAWLAIQIQAVMQHCQGTTATAYLQQLSQHIPPDQRSFMLMHQYFEQQGQLAEAEQLLVDLLTRHPNEAWAINELAYRWVEQDIKLEQAEVLLAKAVKIAPENSNILDSYGWVLYKQGKLQRALSFLEQAAAIGDHPEITKHLQVVKNALKAKQGN